MRILHLVITSLLIYTSLSHSETHISGGNISGTWMLSSSPYIIQGNCIVTSSDSLIIEPGVHVFMEPLCRIRIEGQILAIGTETDSIVFTAAFTNLGCEGIDFLDLDFNSLDSSRLEYCEISYGEGSPAPDLYMDGGAVFMKNSSKVIISHCLITNNRTLNVIGANGNDGLYGGGDGETGESVSAGNGGAIYLLNSAPLITDNTICYNHCGDGIGGNGGDGGDDITYAGGANGGNGGAAGSGFGGQGGALYLENSDAIIQRNYIHHNSSGSGYGGNGGSGGNAFCWEGPSFGGNGRNGNDGNGGAGGAIYILSSNAILKNNLITDNFTGEGEGGDGGERGEAEYSWGSAGNGGDGYGGKGYSISAEGNSNTIELCTISNHNILSYGIGGGCPSTGWPGLGFDGIRIIDGNGVLIKNCIIWSNADPSLSTAIQVSYTCSESYIAGTGNICTDPLFVSPVFENYCLCQTSAGQTQQSPCVDAGNPASPVVIGTTRTDGLQDSGVVDMGYHYPNSTLFPFVNDIVINIEEDDIILSWYAAITGQLYNVYRSDVPYFDITGMTPLAQVTDPQYVDLSAFPGGPWYYIVTVEY